MRHRWMALTLGWVACGTGPREGPQVACQESLGTAQWTLSWEAPPGTQAVTAEVGDGTRLHLYPGDDPAVFESMWGVGAGCSDAPQGLWFEAYGREGQLQRSWGEMEWEFVEPFLAWTG